MARWGRLTVRCILRRVGRRGAILLFLAVLDLGVGYSLLGQPSAIQRAQNLTLPLTAWAWMWIATGLVCAAGAPLPQRRDVPAFGAAAALKFAWTTATFRAGVLQPTPRWWIAPLIFGAFALATLVVAGWQENPPAPPGRTRGDGVQRV